MGWKGTLRTIQSASNKAQRHKDRVHRAADKAHAKLDQMGGKIQEEYAKEVEKLDTLQEAFKKSPITKTGMEYDERQGKFKINPVKDNKGAIQYSIELEWNPSAQLPDARQLEIDGHTITLEALCFAQFATYVAFKIDRVPGVIQDKRKFIYKQSPAKSIIRIESKGRTYLAVDGQIDNPVMGNGYIGVVAFQPFEEPVNELTVTFYIDGQPYLYDQPHLARRVTFARHWGHENQTHPSEPRANRGDCPSVAPLGAECRSRGQAARRGLGHHPTLAQAGESASFAWRRGRIPGNPAAERPFWCHPSLAAELAGWLRAGVAGPAHC